MYLLHKYKDTHVHASKLYLIYLLYVSRATVPNVNIIIKNGTRSRLLKKNWYIFPLDRCASEHSCYNGLFDFQNTLRPLVNSRPPRKRLWECGWF